MTQPPKQELDLLWLLIVSMSGLSIILIAKGFENKNNVTMLFGTLILVGTIIFEVKRGREFKEKVRIFEEERSEKMRVEEEDRKRRRRDEEEYEKSQKAKGLIKIIRYGKEHWVTLEQEREWKFIDVDLENNFQKLSPRQFEKAIQELFIKMKYEVTLTTYTGDYGADLIIKKDSETLVVQCKKYMEQNKVGAPEVQRTLGSMYRYNASKAILITTSDFTNQARVQARQAPIELWNKRILREQFMKAYLDNS